MAGYSETSRNLVELQGDMDVSGLRGVGRLIFERIGVSKPVWRLAVGHLVTQDVLQWVNEGKHSAGRCGDSREFRAALERICVEQVCIQKVMRMDGGARGYSSGSLHGGVQSSRAGWVPTTSGGGLCCKTWGWP